MKILLVNPNTTQAITDRLAVAARAVARRGTRIVAVTGRSGPAVIRSLADNLVAERTCLVLAAAHAKGCDAVVLGVSLDTALEALRERLDIPVLGMTGAGLALACAIAQRYALLTFGRHMAPMYRGLARRYGHAPGRCAVAALGLPPTEVFTHPGRVKARTISACRQLARQGAGAVVLAGAVYAGMARELQADVPVALVDGIQSAVMLAEALARMRAA